MAKNAKLGNHTQFTLSRSNPNHRAPLDLLRAARDQGLANIIGATDKAEIYEIGAPVALQLPASIETNPQWWIGLTRAEMKAGPWADDEDVKRAAITLKGMETRKANVEARAERKGRVIEGGRGVKVRPGWHGEDFEKSSSRSSGSSGRTGAEPEGSGSSVQVEQRSEGDTAESGTQEEDPTGTQDMSTWVDPDDSDDEDYEP